MDDMTVTYGEPILQDIPDRPTAPPPATSGAEFEQMVLNPKPNYIASAANWMAGKISSYKDPANTAGASSAGPIDFTSFGAITSDWTGGVDFLGKTLSSFNMTLESIGDNGMYNISAPKASVVDIAGFKDSAAYKVDPSRFNINTSEGQDEQSTLEKFTDKLEGGDIAAILGTLAMLGLTMQHNGNQMKMYKETRDEERRQWELMYNARYGSSETGTGTSKGGNSGVDRGTSQTFA